MQYQIVENAPIAPGVFLMDLEGDTAMISAPGQFVQLQIPGFFLRRPISICDWDENGMTLIYKAVGQGTEALSHLSTGDILDGLCGLGNGYDVTGGEKKPLVIGGGVGVPPLYLLARTLLGEGKRPQVILGFNTREEVFYEERFRDLGCQVTVTTADGSYGTRGFVTHALPGVYSHVYTCGPLPMLRAVYDRTETDGQYSFEERMGCGFGACVGCTRRTVTGYKRVCKDGPVFRKGEILWED